MKKKVVKVEICRSAFFKISWWFTSELGPTITSTSFRSSSYAIHNARQFFKKLGYEVEVVK